MVQADRPWLGVAGAPLDAIKLVAAGLMVLDHVNSALGTPPSLLAWRFGRIAFPLFCFALALHLVRGVDPKSYLLRLLAAGLLTQPVFSAAFPWSPSYANILFTLAAGCAVAAVLKTEPGWVSHAALAAGAVAIFLWPLRARTGVDFGLAGALLPAALTLTLAGSRTHAPWILVMVAGLNAGAPRPGDESQLWGTLLDGAFALIGTVAVIGLASALLRGVPRFLPRYAFYAFYPAHLMALAAWRAWS